MVARGLSACRYRRSMGPRWRQAGVRQVSQDGDLNTANRLKHAYVAAFKGQIAALARRKPNELSAFSELYEKALAWRGGDGETQRRSAVCAPDGTPTTPPTNFSVRFLMRRTSF